MPIIANNDGQKADILLYGPIGDTADFGPSAIPLQSFVEALAELRDVAVTVRINSPGGDAFVGFAMADAMRSHPKKVNTLVEGLAASAAATVAIGGKRLSMGPAAMLMIHDSWGLAIGNKGELRKQADVLEKIDGMIASGYAARSKRPLVDVLAMMAAETWMTGAEAVQAGFADEVIGGIETPAYPSVAAFAYRNAHRLGEIAAELNGNTVADSIRNKERDRRIRLLYIDGHEMRN